MLLAVAVKFSALLGVADCDSAAYATNGDVFLACHTPDEKLPVAAKPARGVTQGDRFDGLVIRFRPSNGKVLWATRIGGSEYDNAIRIAVGRAGFVYTAGFTKSRDFPVTADALQSKLGGTMDAFLAKLAPDGRLLFATLIGGSGMDQGNALAIDPKGTVYVGGTTWSPDFPGAEAGAQSGDAFVAAVDLPGRIRSVVFGGSAEEKLTGIALDGRGGLFATGFTPSRDFPVTGASQLRGSSDAFLARFSVPGLERTHSMYVGGAGADAAWGVTVDRAGRPLIAGSTEGLDGAASRGGSDAFVASLGGPDYGAVRAIVLGGSMNDSAGYDGQDIAVDRHGNVWLAGETHSPDLAVTRGAFPGVERNGFVAAIAPDLGRVCFAEYRPGPGLSEGVAISRQGRIFVTGVVFGAKAPEAIDVGEFRANAALLEIAPGNACR